MLVVRETTASTPALLILERPTLNLTDPQILAPLFGVLGVIVGAVVSGVMTVRVERERSSAALQQQRREHRRVEYAELLDEIDRRWDVLDRAAGQLSPVDTRVIGAANSALLLIGDEASARLTAVWQLQSRDAAMVIARHNRAMEGQPPDLMVEAYPLSSKQQRTAATGKLTDALRAELGLSPLAAKRPQVADDAG